MNVEVNENNVTQVFVAKKLLSDWGILTSSENNKQTVDPKVIALSVASSAVIVIIILVIICLCKRKRRRKRALGKGRVVSSSTTTTSCSSVNVVPSKVELRTTEDVTRRYQRSVSNLSAKSQIFLVPFDVLPPDFDYSSREVQVKADYVILKDLALLDRYPSNGVVNMAYETQEPYNTSITNGSCISINAKNGFYRSTVANGSYGSLHSEAGERLQKQSPYNPTFY